MVQKLLQANSSTILLYHAAVLLHTALSTTRLLAAAALLVCNVNILLHDHGCSGRVTASDANKMAITSVCTVMIPKSVC
jgi:hypothetical protein